MVEYKIEEVNIPDETIDAIGEVEIVEEYLDIDDSLIEYEKKNELIRIDMNIIEYPIFSKAKIRKLNKGKRYNFKTDGSSYLEVTPTLNSKIPGEFEERVFLSITKIMRDNNYSSSFYVTANEILRNMNIKKVSNMYRKKLKEAVDIIATTTYTFFNSLYSNELKGIVDREVKTNIMTIESIKRDKNTYNSIEYFEDKRIKEVYKISLSDYFYDNIIKKGYLTFDSDKLLEMKNATTRSIYTMIEKWRKYDLYLKRPAFHIARRIPLSWSKSHISETISRIETSCEELVEKKLIKKYNKIKLAKDKISKTEFEFIFDEVHNKNKRSDFYLEKDSFNEMFITHTEQKEVNNNQIEEAVIVEESKNKLSVEEVQKIKEALPKTAQKLKTIERIIKENGKKYSFDYLLACAEYTYKNAKSSYWSYFKKTIENNFAEEYIIKKREQKEINLAKEAKIKNQQKEIQIEAKRKEKISKEREQAYNKFLSLNEKERKEIEIKVLNKFKLKSSLKDEKILMKIFIPARIALISRYMLDIFNNQSKEKKVLVKKEKLTITKEKNLEKEKQILEKTVQYIYNIEEKFESISSFAMKVLKILKELEINDYTEVLEVLKTFEEFSDTLDTYRIELKYINNEYSYIRISK